MELARRVDFVLIAGQEKFELFTLFRGDEELRGGEAVFAGVLSAAGFTFFGARAGASAKLRVGSIQKNVVACCP